MSCSGYILVGPTATGKTRVAHELARQRGQDVISADSMLVYRGMDVGTAKPSLKEQSEVPYHGINLADADEDFSIAHWLGSLHGLEGDVIVTGGTGLYIKALLQGLGASAAPDPAVRAVLEGCSVQELQDRLLDIDALALDNLADPQNPRRLIRAIERDGETAETWTQFEQSHPIVGLWMEPAMLRNRIQTRIHQMIDSGWEQEIRQLLSLFPEWSRSAGQAIGYSELVSWMKGEMSLEQGIERVVIRTARLAKRQRTWFRNQLDVEWIEVSNNGDLLDVVDRVQAIWHRDGPHRLHL